jgi:hypothetical protein
MMQTTAAAKPQLDSYRQATLDRAREALSASQADTDPASYPRHLGRLEVVLADLIRLTEHLAGNG